MANISLKVNLRQLKHVQREMNNKDGKKIKVLIIPIEENDLFQGEKGVYFDMTAIEIKDRSKFAADQKDTHLVKQSLPKAKYDAMSDEQKKAMPILGNAILWGRQEAAPQESGELSESDVNKFAEEDHDDLPF